MKPCVVFPLTVCRSFIKAGKGLIRAARAARFFTKYVSYVAVMPATSRDAIALPRPLLWQLGDLAVLTEYYDLRRNTSNVMRRNITITFSKKKHASPLSSNSLTIMLGKAVVTITLEKWWRIFGCCLLT